MKLLLRRSSPIYQALRAGRSRAIRSVKRWHGVHPTSFIHPSSRISQDLRTEEYVFLGPECWIGPQTRIGRYSLFGPRVAVVGDDHVIDEPSVPMHFSGRPAQQETRIGRDVWVGYGAIIRRGVTIHDGAVIAAGAVVTKDVPPLEVWAGVPARPIRQRFADPAIAEEHLQTINGPLIDPNFAEPQPTENSSEDTR